MSDVQFELAGAELDWPIGSAAGMTNHPDIEIVANRLEDLAYAGLSFNVLGSWTIGDARGGNGYVRNQTGGWDYLGGDEYVDMQIRAGFNAKGLPNPGTDEGMNRLSDLVHIARSKGVEAALSLSPHGGNPLEELKEIIAIAKTALSKGVLFVEVNLSCPNVPGRPPFYQDFDGVTSFQDMLNEADLMLNKNDYPGLYVKYGPIVPNEDENSVMPMYVSPVRSTGGRVTSNTKGNQTPIGEDGENAIKVNEGKAGMSGPALSGLGRRQLIQLARTNSGVIRSASGSLRGQELISALGVSTGQEVHIRRGLGANAVELGSVIYWPQLIGCETAGEAVEQIKEQFVDASTN